MHTLNIPGELLQEHITLPDQQQQPIKKRSFKRLSFFKAATTTTTTPTSESPVLTTNTINKEYDVETGNKIINNFMILTEIGRGMHGKVKLAEDLDTGELVAIKIVDKQSRRRQLGYSILRDNNNTYLESEQKIRREIAILKKCAHPHVVRLLQVIDDPSNRKIYLALEYMEGGEIIWRQDDDSNQPILSINESRTIFRHIVSGLDYLHYQGIIHRDIKPANLLLTSDKIVKISDFGVSYFNQHLAGNHSEYNDEIDRELSETAGTPAFFAPELCSSHGLIEQHQHVTKAIDVWALGVTLYCLIFGQCPFTASTEFELFDIIPTASLVFPFTIPDSLVDLLEQLLKKDAQDRITLEQVKHHPWVIQDLQDPTLWWQETDPSHYKTVQATEEAVTVMDRLRKSIHRISSSLSNLSLPFRSHQSWSLPRPSSPCSDMHPSHTTTSTSPVSSQHPYYQAEGKEYIEEEHHKQGWIPTSFTNTTLSTLPSTNSLEKKLAPRRPPFQNESSGSSMSGGLVVTFSHSSTDQK